VLQPAWDPATLQAAVNSKAAQLGYPLALTAVHAVPYGFSARFDSISKTYLYRMYFPQAKSAVLHPPPLAADGTAWFLRAPLDVPAMAAAAAALQGKHDCSVLRSAGCQAVSPVKTLEQVTVLHHPPAGALPPATAWEGVGPYSAAAAASDTQPMTAPTPGDMLQTLVHEDGGLSRLDILVKGPSFLYNMVRNIAGLLAWAGQGHASPEQVAAWLHQGAPRSVAKYPTAPAHGLTLLGVEYPPLDLLIHEVQRDQRLLCPAMNNQGSTDEPICGGACALFRELSGEATASDPSQTLQGYFATSGGGAECCRALHSARRVRAIHNNGGLDADGWSHAAHAQLVKQYGGRSAARQDAGAQAAHEADWGARRQRAAQRSGRIIRLTARTGSSSEGASR